MDRDHPGFPWDDDVYLGIFCVPWADSLFDDAG